MFEKYFYFYTRSLAQQKRINVLPSVVCCILHGLIALILQIRDKLLNFIEMNYESKHKLFHLEKINQRILLSIKFSESIKVLCQLQQVRKKKNLKNSECKIINMGNWWNQLDKAWNKLILNNNLSLYVLFLTQKNLLFKLNLTNVKIFFGTQWRFSIRLKSRCSVYFAN